MSLSIYKSISSVEWYPPAETKIPVKALVAAVLQGPADFERHLCNYLGVDMCILESTGRSLLCRLLKALRMMDERKRDEVLIPGYTCYSVAASVVRAGLKIRVYDLEPDTLNPSMDSLKENINDMTVAIIGQHLFGIPTSLEGLKNLASERCICFIEDSAQALGAKLKQNYLGTIGDFGLYSFGRGKPLPIGEGGALIGRDSSVLKELDLTQESSGWKSTLKAAGVQIMSQSFVYGLAEALPLGLGETVFEPDIQNAPMSISMKKVAVKALGFLPALNSCRNIIARVYMDHLDKSRTIPIIDDATPIFTRFPVMAGPRNISRGLRRLGVRRMYPKAIQDEFSIRPYLADNHLPTPGSALIAESLITLPTHHMITETLAREIAREVKEHYRW